jgi:DNA-binding MarR family transcriptional regulator
MRANRKPILQDVKPTQARQRREFREVGKALGDEPHFGFLLNHLAKDWTARLERRLRKKGVTSDQWRVLLVTSQVESMNIMELRDATLVPHSTLGRWLHRLEALGLVHLRTDPRDQRSVAISIAPAGRKLFETLLPIAEQTEQDALAGFDLEDRRLLRDYIRRIQRNLRTG